MRNPIFIAHRALFNGPDELRENHPNQIQAAFNNAFDVEIDVWYKSGRFFLGHDAPKYEIPTHYLINNKLWCHAKDEITFLTLASIKPRVHYFWHEKDTYTITSEGYIWSYPEVMFSKDSIIHIINDSEINKDIIGVRGIVSNNINKIRNEYFNLL